MTNSFNNLFPRFLAFTNFHSAFQKARKLKTFHSDVLKFEYNLEDNIFDLQNELKEEKYDHGGYHCFTVNDPKYREIKAAPFRDRVVHHALCNIIEPIFDNCFIFDSYACRKEKGTHKAVKRLKTFLQSVESSSTKREREKERGSGGRPFPLSSNLLCVSPKGPSGCSSASCSQAVRRRRR